MPCPHFSVQENECRLLEEADPEDDEGQSSPLDDRVNREWCLGQEKGYRNCPIFRSYLTDLHS